MEHSGPYMRDVRTVTVGPSSTQIAGVNAKRFRLTIYPTSTTQVWVDPRGPAVANSGMLVVQGHRPVILGEREHPGEFTESVQAITAAGNANVIVQDEFWG